MPNIPPSQPGDPDAIALAARLRQARERLGASVRDLERQAGIPAATISAIERGREPRWSTLMRYIETVPGLRAADLLPGPIHHPPAASPSLFAYLRRVTAIGARSVTMTRRPEGRGARVELRVVDLVTEQPETTPPKTALMLMRLALIGPAELARSLVFPEGEGRVVLRDGDIAHAFDVALDDGVRVSYFRSEPLSEEAAPSRMLEHAATFAIDELTLATELAGDETEPDPRLLAWPSSRRVEGSPGEISALLYPAGRMPSFRREGRRISLTLRDIIPYMTHAIAWGSAEESPRPGLDLGDAAEGEPELAPIARALRRRAGRSARDLGEQMGVSHVTLAEVEKGRDTKASTLRRYLRALPDVPPQWLLPAREASGDLTPEEAWSSLRDLHGVVADEATSSIVVAPDGTYETEEVWRGVRTVDGIGRNLGLNRLPGKDIYAAGQTAVTSMETDASEAEDDVVSRLRRLPSGRPLHDLKIPPALARRGLSWRVTLRSTPGFNVSRAAALRKHGMDPSREVRFTNGVATVPILPARSVRLSVCFPEGFAPIAIWPTAIPAERPFAVLTPGVLETAHPGRFSFVSKDDGREHVLAVELPLFGLKYGIGWAL